MKNDTKIDFAKEGIIEYFGKTQNEEVRSLGKFPHQASPSFEINASADGFSQEGLENLCKNIEVYNNTTPYKLILTDYQYRVLNNQLTVEEKEQRDKWSKEYEEEKKIEKQQFNLNHPNFRESLKNIVTCPICGERFEEKIEEYKHFWCPNCGEMGKYWEHNSNNANHCKI